MKGFLPYVHGPDILVLWSLWCPISTSSYLLEAIFKAESAGFFFLTKQL